MRWRHTLTVSALHPLLQEQRAQLSLLGQDLPRYWDIIERLNEGFQCGPIHLGAKGGKGLEPGHEGHHFLLLGRVIHGMKRSFDQ